MEPNKGYSNCEFTVCKMHFVKKIIDFKILKHKNQRFFQLEPSYLKKAPKTILFGNKHYIAGSLRPLVVVAGPMHYAAQFPVTLFAMHSGTCVQVCV